MGLPGEIRRVPFKLSDGYFLQYPSVLPDRGVTRPQEERRAVCRYL
jgi:hypothetical protein